MQPTSNPSIVDYLSSKGQASDYNSRATLAASKGITNYTGTAEQNTNLLNMLRGSGSNTPATSQTVVTSARINQDTIPGITNQVNNLTKNTGAGNTTTNGTDTSKTDTSGLDAQLKQYGLTGLDPNSVENSVVNSAEYQAIQNMKQDALNSNDASYQSTLATIQSQFAQKYKTETEAQTSQNAQLGNLLQLTGATHTSGENSVMSAKTSYDLQNLQEIQNAENSAVNQAKAAHDNASFQIAQGALDRVQKFRDQKNQIAQTISADLTKQAKDLQLQKITAARDNVVAGFVLQGITDPKKILEAINKDPNQAGGAFTAEELQKTLKNLSPEGNYDKLSSNVKDFMTLKDMGSLPEGVTTIKQWIDYIKPTKVAGVGSVNKLTMTEAKSQGLPLSTVGMSEQDIADSFNSITPPQWFVEKMQGEMRMSIPASGLQTQWDTYKNTYNKSREKTAPQSTAQKASTNNVEKATDYFKTAYGSAIDDATIQSLADRVNMYVEGGQPYNAAIKKVIQEATK